MKKIIALFFTLVSCSKGENSTNGSVVPVPVASSQSTNDDHVKSHSLEVQPCQTGMVEIQGTFCPKVEQECITWVDQHGNKMPAPTGNLPGRCGVFKSPSKCLSKPTQLINMHYCIDKYEYPNVEGSYPEDWKSWNDMKFACESKGKRLCTNIEWTFACEGKEMDPYPYGNGYARDKTKCNFDNEPPGNVFTASKETLRSFLVPSGKMKDCVSKFGVHDMVGNIDEWVINSQPGHKSLLVGGHIFGFRNACRPITAGHNETFNWYETGGRCCDAIKLQ